MTNIRLTQSVTLDSSITIDRFINFNGNNKEIISNDGKGFVFNKGSDVSNVIIRNTGGTDPNSFMSLYGLSFNGGSVNISNCKLSGFDTGIHIRNCQDVNITKGIDVSNNVFSGIEINSSTVDINSKITNKTEDAYNATIMSSDSTINDKTGMSTLTFGNQKQYYNDKANAKLYVKFIKITPDTDLLGKKMSDLANDIEIDKFGKVTGTLKYVKDYTGFSSNPDEQEGFFLPFKLDTESRKTTNTVAKFEVVGGNKGAVDFDKSDFTSVVFLGKTSEEVKSKSVKVTVDWTGGGTKVIEFIMNFDNLIFKTEEVIATQYSKDELISMSKSDLQNIASEMGIDASGTKDTIADRIIESYNN